MSADSPPPPTTAPRRSAGRDLRAAITVGVVLAIAFFVTLFLSDLAFLTFVAVVVIVALLELDHAFRARDTKPATVVAVAAGLVALYGGYLDGPPAQVLGLVVAVFGAMVWTLLDPARHRPVASLGMTMLMVCWVPFLASFLGLLLARDDGARYVIMTIALVVANDIGAYAVGHRIGRHKLAPTVSPGKSWEGFVGGLLVVLVIAAAGLPWLLPAVEVGTALVIGAALTVAATVGDLAESLVKRDLGIKDLGTILPGHGGVMDRVDAMLFALPTAHLVLLALGL